MYWFADLTKLQETVESLCKKPEYTDSQAVARKRQNFRDKHDKNKVFSSRTSSRSSTNSRSSLTFNSKSLKKVDAKKFITTNAQTPFSKKKKFLLQDSDVFCDECEKPEVSKSQDIIIAPENLSLRQSPIDLSEFSVNSSFQTVSTEISDRKCFSTTVS